MISLIKRLFHIRIVRYGLVGGIGIPINNVALFCFTLLLAALPLTVRLPLFGHAITADLHFALESACAFEVSNIINFVLNQRFTYSEQFQHIHGWEWVRRIAKGQLTSLSSLLLSFLIALTLVYAFHVNAYLANDTGIVLAFVYNFFISNKLVFRPTTPVTSLSPVVVEGEGETKIEVTPK